MDLNKLNENKEQPLEEEEELEEELDEAAKPDFLDLDKDGDKEEPMKDADKEELDEISMGMGTGHDPNVPPEIKRDNDKFMKKREKQKSKKDQTGK